MEGLLDKGYAYVAGGNVYFDTSRLERYYIFNSHDEEDLAVGVREGVEEDENKRNKNDFVLWFTKSKFEDQALKWDSPWGVGYPGWLVDKPKGKLGNVIGEDCRNPGRRRTIAQNKAVYPIQNKQFYPNP